MTTMDMPRPISRIPHLLLVGMLLGVLQTGLFFQLSFTLSSTFGTFLLITLCWLAGSALGVMGVARATIATEVWLLLALVAYAISLLLAQAAPFNTALWPLYGALIVLGGLYPGVFFARYSRHSRAGTMLLWENNGFIIGLVGLTLLFMLLGRGVLWLSPALLALLVLFTRPLHAVPQQG